MTNRAPMTPEEREERAAERAGLRLARLQAERDAARAAAIQAGTYRRPGRPKMDPEVKKETDAARRLRHEARRREHRALDLRTAREALASALSAHEATADPVAKEKTAEALRAARIVFVEKQEAFLSLTRWQRMIIKQYWTDGDVPSDPRSQGVIRYYTTPGRPSYDAEFAAWVKQAGAEVDDEGEVFGAKEWSPAEVAIIRERSRAAHVARGGTVRDVGAGAIAEKKKSEV